MLYLHLKGMITLVTSDHDHRLLKPLIGWEMSDGPTSFYQATMGEHNIKWMGKWYRSDMESYMSRNV